MSRFLRWSVWAVMLVLSTPGLQPASVAWAQNSARTAPPIGSPVPVPIPLITRDVLPNGVRVVYARTSDVPICDLGLLIQAGTSSETKGLEGIASLSAQTIFSSVPDLPSRKIESEFSRLGSHLSLTVKQDYVLFQVRSLARNFPRTTQLLAQVALSTAIDDDEFATLVKRAQQRRAGLRVSTAEQTSMAVLETMYGTESAFVRPAVGTASSLAHLSSQDVRAFIANRYRPENATVIVAGGVEYSSIRPILLDRFGSWKGEGSSSTASPSLTPITTSAAVLIRDTSKSLTHFRIGFHTLPRTDPQFPAVLALVTALGGSDESVLGAKLIKERKITPSIYAGISAFREAGYMIISGSVPGRYLDSTLSIIFSVLNSIPHQGLPSAALTEAKSGLLSHYDRGFNTARRLFGKLVDVAVNDLSTEEFRGFHQKISSLQQEDLNRFSSMLDPRKMVLAASGNAAVVGPVLLKYADLYGLKMHERDAQYKTAMDE